VGEVGTLSVVLEVMIALAMRADHREFLALVLAELALEGQLFLGELEGLANSSFLVNASQVEYFNELKAGLVHYLVLVPHADNVGGSSFRKYSSCRLRVAASHKH